MRGGFIPWPRGDQLGDYCAAVHNKFSSQGSTRRYFLILFSQVGAEESFSEEPFVSQPCDEPSDVMIHSIHSGSVEGLSPGTDEADRGVSGVATSKNTETKTSGSRNPVAGGGSGGDTAPEVTAAMEATVAKSSRHTPHTHICTYIRLHQTFTHQDPMFLICIFRD